MTFSIPCVSCIGGGYSKYFVSLIPTECCYNHTKLVWWIEKYCWGRKSNCQRPGSNQTIGVLCLQVCHGSFHGKPKRQFFKGKLWYVSLLRVNLSVRYLVVLLIVKTKEKNACFNGREPRPTTLEAGHVTTLAEARRLAERFLGELILIIRCFHADFSYYRSCLFSTNYLSSPE